jgi:anti-sigma factor ChrR (cupin superfamily)
MRKPFGASGETPVFDSATLDALLLSLAPIALPPERAPLLRERVLAGIALQTGDADKITIPADAGQWTPIAPKVAMKMLNVTAQSRTFLLRLEPGGRIPAHDHPADEECMVLEGEVFLGATHATAGTFHLAPEGTQHGEIHSPGGALLYLRIASPVAVHG